MRIFIKALFKERAREWGDTFLWLFYTLFGGLMPIWGGYIGLRILSKSPSFETFTQNGELALISASLLAASYYLITRKSVTNIFKDLYNLVKRRKIPKQLLFPGQAILSPLIYSLGGVSAALFAFTNYTQIPDIAVSPDENFIQFSSIVIFLVSLALSFIIVLIDNFWTPEFHMAESRKADIRSLAHEVEELEKG